MADVEHEAGFLKELMQNHAEPTAPWLGAPMGGLGAKLPPGIPGFCPYSEAGGPCIPGGPCTPGGLYPVHCGNIDVIYNLHHWCRLLQSGLLRLALLQSKAMHIA